MLENHSSQASPGSSVIGVSQLEYKTLLNVAKQYGMFRSQRATVEECHGTSVLNASLRLMTHTSANLRHNLSEGGLDEATLDVCSFHFISEVV